MTQSNDGRLVASLASQTHAKRIRSDLFESCAGAGIANAKHSVSAKKGRTARIHFLLTRSATAGIDSERGTVQRSFSIGKNDVLTFLDSTSKRFGQKLDA